MTWRRLVLLVLPLALATCREEDMYTQQRADAWGGFWFLQHHMTMQHPVSGTVARNAPATSASEPSIITEALLSRGQQHFHIFCAPCHAESGDGAGMVVQRGFPKPPPLFSDELIKAKAQHFYDVITNGHGVMYSYADRVSPADRWAIAAYIRALQRSQHAQIAILSNSDKAHLQEASP